MLDPSKTVIRQAIEIYRRGRLGLKVETLELTLKAASDKTRPAVLAAAQVLEKWEALSFLLRHLVSSNASADLVLQGDCTMAGASKSKIHRSLLPN